MELEQLGKLVAEALALQGKVMGLQKEIGVLDNQISANGKEIERLVVLSKATEEVMDKQMELAGELSALSVEMQKRIKYLGDAGVILPIGEKAHSKQVSL